MKLKKEYYIEKQSGRAFILTKDQRLQVIDVEGKQVADLVAYNLKNKNENLSTAVTLDNLGSIFVTKGDYLFSNKYNRMVKITEDTVGKHDILHPACSTDMYRYQYHISNHHPSCIENLAESLKEYGIMENEICTPFNIFMNTKIASDGKIVIQEPVSRSGDYIELSAEMDLIVGVSACSVEESRCNAFQCTPIRLLIFELQ